MAYGKNIIINIFNNDIEQAIRTHKKLSKREGIYVECRKRLVHLSKNMKKKLKQLETRRRYKRNRTKSKNN